jgi:response regulator RpfG family c-di-GMP phosphodiesterase
MAVIDVYDALVSERSYKEPLDDNEVVKIIKEESGKHFDPEIVKIFLEVKDLFREIALCLMPSSKTI